MADSHREEIAKLEALYSNNPEGRVFTHLAEAYRKSGELNRAREILDRGLGRHADYASAHVVLGRVLMDMGQADDARGAFRRVLELDRHNLIALRSLGELAERAGDAAEALQYYRDLVALDPNDDRLLETVARLEDSAQEPAGVGLAEPQAGALPEPPASMVETGPGRPDRADTPAVPSAPESATAVFEAAFASVPVEAPIDVTGGTEGDAGAAPDEEPSEPAYAATPSDLNLADAVITSDYSFATGGTYTPPGGEEQSDAVEETAQLMDALGFDEVEAPEFPAVGDVAEDVLPESAGVTQEGEVGEPAGVQNWEREFADQQDGLPGDLAFAASADIADPAGVTGIGESGGAVAESELPDLDPWPDLDAREDVGAEVETTEVEVSLPYAEASGGESGAEAVELAEGGYLDSNAWSRVAGQLGEDEDVGIGEIADLPIEFAGLDATTGEYVGEPLPSDIGAGAEPGASDVVTETMAELYAAQGLHARAAEIYRTLLKEKPDDERLARRLGEMEGTFDAGAPARDAELPVLEDNAFEPIHEDELELEETPGWLERVESAWTGGSGVAGAGPTPYAWTDSGQAQEPAGGASIAEYFRGLLGWRPAEPAGSLDLTDEQFAPWAGGMDALPVTERAVLADDGDSADEDEDLEMFRSWLQSLKK